MPNSNDIQAWGPRIAPDARDYVTTDTEKSRGFSLDQVSTYTEDQANQRTTLDTVMRRIWEKLREEPQFKHVNFTTDYPNGIEDAPRVIWRLVSRQAGIDGKNRVSPFLVGTFPMEDGTIIQKSAWPQSITVSIQVFETTVDAASALANDIEGYLTLNPTVWESAGAKHFHFATEGGHEQFKVGASQPLEKRTLNFSGSVTYIYCVQLTRLQTINVRVIGENLSVLTTAITRSPSATADLFPVVGPLALICLHSQVDQTTEDFLPGIDFEILSNFQEFGMQFYIQWAARGKRPDPSAIYYATYAVFSPSDARATAVISEDNTDPNAINTNLRPNRRGPARRSAILPRVLGQEQQPDRGRQIGFLQQDGPTQVSGLASSLMEAMVRATSEVVVIYQPNLT